MVIQVISCESSLSMQKKKKKSEVSQLYNTFIRKKRNRKSQIKSKTSTGTQSRFKCHFILKTDLHSELYHMLHMRVLLNKECKMQSKWVLLFFLLWTYICAKKAFHILAMAAQTFSFTWNKRHCETIINYIPVVCSYCFCETISACHSHVSVCIFQDMPAEAAVTQESLYLLTSICLGFSYHESSLQ